MANNIPLVEADPAMMKLQFINPPKKAASPVNAPSSSAMAIANSPKMMIFENQVCYSEFTRNSMNDRYQSYEITGLGATLRPLCQ